MILLDYPLTRSFHWRWFTLASTIGAVIVIVVLGVVNTALTGYETITVFHSNFNVIQTLWYDRFIPFRASKPGTLCDSHVFNVGDPFTTNYSFFQWNVDSIVQPNAGESGVSYSGAPLTSCDVAVIYIDGSLLSWTLDFTVITNCTEKNSWNVTARTSFSMTSLPGRFSPVLGVEQFRNDGTKDIRGSVLSRLINDASRDAGNRAYNALVFSNRSSPIALSLQANFDYCPMSLGLNSSCATKPPQFDIMLATVLYPNSTIDTYYKGLTTDPIMNPWVLDNDTQLPLYNLLQTVYASVRIDLGIPSPNNFILNRTALNGTIAPIFPLTRANGEAFSNSTVYAEWTAGGRLSDLEVGVSGPATIQVVYPCRFQQLKSSGQLVISVLVATLSMFSSGWALFMFIATAIAKRNNPTANRCDGHCFQHRPDLESIWFKASEKRTFPDIKKRLSGTVYKPVAKYPSTTTATSDTEVHSTSGPQVDF